MSVQIEGRVEFNGAISNSIEFLDLKKAQEEISGNSSGKDYDGMKAILLRVKHDVNHVKALINGVFAKGHGSMTVLRQISKEDAISILESVDIKVYTKEIAIEYASGIKTFTNIDWQRVVLSIKRTI